MAEVRERLHGLHLRASELCCVRDLLSRHVPQAKVFVFGSRATGVRLKRFSDLDLLLDMPQPLPLDQLADLRDALSESDLPFRVDIVERIGLAPSFAASLQASGPVPLDNAIALNPENST